MGDLIDKSSVKNKAIKYMKSQDPDTQELGATIIAQISPLGPNPQFFFQDITLLINSNNEVFYKIGIEAVKKYIKDHAENYCPKDYIWIEKYPYEPTHTTVKWIKLLSDIGMDQTLPREAREHIGKKLNSLGDAFNLMNDKDIKYKLGLSQEKIDESKKVNLLNAQTVAAEILLDLL